MSKTKDQAGETDQAKRKRGPGRPRSPHGRHDRMMIRLNQRERELLEWFRKLWPNSPQPSTFLREFTLAYASALRVVLDKLDHDIGTFEKSAAGAEAKGDKKLAHQCHIVADGMMRLRGEALDSILRKPRVETTSLRQLTLKRYGIDSDKIVKGVSILGVKFETDTSRPKLFEDEPGGGDDETSNTD